MRLVKIVLISLGCLTHTAFADDDLLSAKQITTLFFGKDHRLRVTDTTQSPWAAIGQLETESGNLCTVTLIAPQIALTAGHCLLDPPDRFDPPVVVRFIPGRKGWRYQIHDIRAKVEPSLVHKLKASGDGWIVPAAAAPYDYGIIILHHPPSAITPVPLFNGTRGQLNSLLKLKHHRILQAGYSADHLDNLYEHNNCKITGWTQQAVFSHRCDTLPGDSGSPLIAKTEKGWQVIAVQSSAPAAADRYRADNRAIAVTSFSQKLNNLIAGQ